VSKLKIRKFKKEDTGDIRRIYAGITQKPVSRSFSRIINEQAQGLDKAVFVAEMDGTVVGYMISYILSGGFGLKKSAWIAQLGVHPQYMGQGIGDSLAQEIFKHCRKIGIKDVYTSVRWDSTDLLSFFKSLGFDRSNFINLLKKL
jgi:N-acetylglutamate synthase-like GNAT family acetyltransferase